MTDLQNITYKTTLIKAGAVLIGFASVCITMGIYLGDWSAWRYTTEKRVNRLEAATFHEKSVTIKSNIK